MFEAERSGLYSCQEWREDLHCSALPTLNDKQLFSVLMHHLKTVTDLIQTRICSKMKIQWLMEAIMVFFLYYKVSH